MDVISQELNIPKRQIKETKNRHRFTIIAHKSWLKSISQNAKLIEFPVHYGLDDWPHGNNLGNSWQKVHVTFYKKLTDKVIPLARNKQLTANSLESTDTDSEHPLLYTQLLQYVSQSNHKNLWKAAYKKYSSSRPQFSNVDNHSNSTNSKKQDNISANLLPHNIVLREAIIRTYGCRIVHSKTEEVVYGGEDDATPTSGTQNETFNHPNLYPVIGTIETNSYFFVIYDQYVEYNLLDCVTFSPAILEKSLNKPLFIIYQLLNLMKSLHDRGLYLGDVGLNDIYMTENLWIKIIPDMSCNLLEYDENMVQEMEDLSLEFNRRFEFQTTPLRLTKELNLAYSLKEYCEMWCYGQLSNFDYLTILNNLSGRRIGCPDYHHIMPWVTDFQTRNGQVWRDLKRSKYRLNKGDPQLDLTFQSHAGSSLINDIPHHVSDVLSEITYYVYMARRTSKSVLCKHVRPIWVPAEYPGSIQRLQEWTPDECIPEFFSDPIVFKSIHEDLPDLEVPVWASCPEDFVTKHREALESQYVSEKLHHWIDLTFGYKLTGSAAVKAKNVCLPLVDEHQNLCQRGVVQLFFNPHPPKQYPSVWNSKIPPRIGSHYENRRRLTRSSEDLSSQNLCTDSYTPKVSPKNSPRPMHKNKSESIERSVSVQQKLSTVIVLPKNYNPISQLTAVENFNIFMSKTFHHNQNDEMPKAMSSSKREDYLSLGQPKNGGYYKDIEFGDNAFTNKIFTETYEASLVKKKKMFENLKFQKINSKRNFKQIFSDMKIRDLRVLGCIIVEMFLATKFRPLGSCVNQDYEDRFEACLKLLKTEFGSLPKCVQYAVKLLLGLSDDEYEGADLQLPLNEKDLSEPPVITDRGLPHQCAHQFLQPLLGNFLIPFPFHYPRIYQVIKTLNQFEECWQMLDLYTFFECDGKECEKYEKLDRTRIHFNRKIAECKVNACVSLVDGFLEPNGLEQFEAIEILLPHLIELIKNDDTSILATWHLFDAIAIVLGSKNSQKYLLEPILQLYDSDGFETKNASFFGYSQESAAMKFTRSTTFKSKKSVKLYHHSFLLKLIVRFGLKCFLEHFIPPLVEAVGGYKDTDSANQYHLHETKNESVFKRSRSCKNFKLNTDSNMDVLSSTISNTLVSPDASDKTLSPNISQHLPLDEAPDDEMFAFEDDQQLRVRRGSDLSEAEVDVAKILENFDISSIDLKLNHSQAEEATEDLPRPEETKYQIKDFIYGDQDFSFEHEDVKSPTIAIPSSFRRSIEVNSIGCEIGSKKSIDSNDFLSSTPSNNEILDGSKIDKTIVPHSKMYSSSTSNSKSSDSKSRNRIFSEMSAESIIWLSHRLGPVLTARYLSRNLLKMLTLCYVGQENLLPNDFEYSSYAAGLSQYSICDGRVAGDQSAQKVVDCLVSIAALFGDQFILRQYFPHIGELIALCKKRITPSLEGGIISALQLLKYLIPYLNDVIIMDQLQDVILRTIIHPTIRLIGSSRFVMPSGYLARSVLARKLIDAIYVLSVRIGPEMTKEHLCVPALQRFFLIFDKAYGLCEHFKDQKNKNDYRIDSSPGSGTEDSNYLEIRRDGGTKEWCLKGQKIMSATDQDSFDSFTPPPLIGSASNSSRDSTVMLREKALEEIKDVFTPNLAYSAYLPFLKFLGQYEMSLFVKNITLVLTLCHEFEQPNYSTMEKDKKFESTLIEEENMDSICSSHTFGSNVIGNRIEIQNDSNKTEIEQKELLNMVTYKLENVNSSRNLRGNWLYYWEHEIGRSEKDKGFFLKQIKLQNYCGHTSAVRSILCLDNENSFMSASKDKTVKLWSLRSEGDGTRASSCQFTYINHRKSVHSLSFLESLRLTISCDSGVHLWDPFVGAHIAQLDTQKYTPVSVVKTYPSPSCIVLAGTAESSLKMIDARTFKYCNEWKVTNAISGTVRSIAVSPSGLWIGVALSSGQITVLDGRTGFILSSWRANDGDLLQLSAPNEKQLISSSLDNNISVWNPQDGTNIFNLRNPPEPAPCLIANGPELLIGTPANRIGVYSSIAPDATYTFTKLRSETFKGVLTSMAVLPLNRLLLVGGDSGNITLLC